GWPMALLTERRRSFVLCAARKDSRRGASPSGRTPLRDDCRVLDAPEPARRTPVLERDARVPLDAGAVLGLVLQLAQIAHVHAAVLDPCEEPVAESQGVDRRRGRSAAGARFGEVEELRAAVVL